MARLSQKPSFGESLSHAPSALAGHLWTIVPSVLHSLRPAQPPASRPWSTLIGRGTDANANPNTNTSTNANISADADANASSIRLHGELCERADSDRLVVIVHGLGGALASHYCVRAAQVLDAHGYSTLRLALRGADRLGEDFYHAGLVADLHAAFASPELSRYSKLFVLGYSLGGHVCLHAAVTPHDPRVRGVAAVCAPLDLERSCQAIDSPSRFIYRRHVLSGLKDIYRAVAQRRAVPTALARIERVKTIREWDALTIVPRYGFADVSDYYTRMSVGQKLTSVAVPTLLLPSRHDPMVPPWTFEDLLPAASPQLTVHWVEHGGHVGYPSRIVIEGQTLGSLEEHVAGWFSRV